MKISKILVLMVFVLILSINVLAADSLIWRTVNGKPSVQSFNALDNGLKHEFEASETKSIMMGLYSTDKILVINSEELTKNNELTCKDLCVIYTGFEKLEEKETFKDIPPYLITSVQEYSPGQPIINSKTGAKIDFLSEDLLNEEIGLENTARACSAYDSEDCSYYQINKNKRHIIRLNKAKVTFDSQGNIKLIQSLSREGLETAWIDSFGIPLGPHDGIDFVTDDEGKTNFNSLRLVINPDLKDKEEWIEKLPKELKDEDKKRSKLTLCGNEFTNYFSGSNFLIEKTEKGCSLKEYTLTTELFVKDDIKNWEEFEYQCGELKFQAMGGKLKNLKCTLSEDIAKDEDVISVKEEDANKQMFRIKTDEYWFSINENAGLQEVRTFYNSESGKRIGLRVKARELRVSHDISGTGGPERYKGDLIKTKGEADTFITFAVPGDSSYKQTTNYLEPQIQVDSKKIEEISRKLKGVEYTYSFQKPNMDYILQLGNDLNRGPIVAIFPTKYDLNNKEIDDIINYKGDDILTFGVNVEQKIKLGKKNIHNYVLTYNPNYKSQMSLAKTESESQTEIVTGEITIGEYVAQKCYGKSYSELNKKEKDNVYDNSLKLRELNPEAFDLGNNFVSGYVTSDMDLTFPGSEITTYENEEGNVVRIKPGLDNCPRLSANNIKKTLSEKKSCVAQNNEIVAVCVKENECSSKPIQILSAEFYSLTTYINEKTSILNQETQYCQKDYVCCRTDKIIPKKTYTKKSQLPRKRGRLGDTPCTSKGGKCAFTTSNTCIDGSWSRNKCLSNSNKEYLCCSSGKLKKGEPKKTPSDLKKLIDDILNKRLEKLICKDSCNPIYNNKDCMTTGKIKRDNSCSFTCGWIEGSGCLTLYKCDAGDSECLNKFSLDKVDGKTCDMINKKDKYCELKQI